jgi:hypothetical protein
MMNPRGGIGERKRSGMRRLMTAVLAPTAILAVLTWMALWLAGGHARPAALARTRVSGASRAIRGVPQRGAPTQERLRMAYARMPLCFEANQGQEDPRVRFVARGNGYGFFLTRNEAVLSLGATSAGQRARHPRAATPSGPSRHCPATPPGRSPAVVRMKLLGANPSPATAGLAPLPGQVHYLVGNDPAQWRTGVRRYSRVRYEDVYPGIDLV